MFHWAEVINYLVNYILKTRLTTGNNIRLRIIARIQSTTRRIIFGFQAWRRKLSTQGQGSVVYTTTDLDSHANTMFCNSNCILMHFMGKVCDVASYTDTYETIK